MESWNDDDIDDVDDDDSSGGQRADGGDSNICGDCDAGGAGDDRDNIDGDGVLPMCGSTTLQLTGTLSFLLYLDQIHLGPSINKFTYKPLLCID